MPSRHSRRIRSSARREAESREQIAAWRNGTHPALHTEQQAQGAEEVMSATVNRDAAALRRVANLLSNDGLIAIADDLRAIAGRVEYSEQWWTAFATDINNRSTDALRNLEKQREPLHGIGTSGHAQG